MKRITTVISGTGKYEICQNEHGFWAIEHMYIGADGHLSKPINGIQGGLRDTLKEAIDGAILCGKVKEFTETNLGVSDEELLAFMVASTA